MLNILGLDVSSSTIGWALLSYENKEIKLKKCGHLKPEKSSSGSLAYRLSKSYDLISNLLISISPDNVVIEQYVNKFSPGRSSSRTIIVLSAFNEMTSVSSIRNLDIEPVKYAVNSIRKSISDEYNANISKKEDCLKFVNELFDNFKIIKNSRGNIKKECYDESDAICVALCYIIKECINGENNII